MLSILQSQQIEKELDKIAKSKDDVALTVFKGWEDQGETRVVSARDLKEIISRIDRSQQFTVTQLDNQGREVRSLPRVGLF